MPRNEIQGILWSLLSVFSFASMTVLVKFTLKTYSYTSTEIVFWRTFPAVLALLVFVYWKRFSLKTPVIKLHISRSASGATSLLLYFYSISKLPLSTAVTISYTSSMSLAILSFFLMKERIRRNSLLGIAIGFIGVFLLLKPDFSQADKLAVTTAVLSSFFAGYAYLNLREIAQAGEPAWRVVFYFSLTATVICIVINFFSGWHNVFTEPKSIIWLLSISGSAFIAQFCLTKAYALGDKFTVSVMSYLTVMLTAIYAYFYFDENLVLSQIFAMLLIVGAGVLSALPSKK